MGKAKTTIRRAFKSKYPNWIEKVIDIKDWIMDKIYYTPKAHFYSLKRVLEWVPVLWRNYDWDSHYIFRILHYKLKRMEKEIRINGNAVNSHKIANEIKTAVLLLDRICDRDYLDASIVPVKREWGDYSYDFSDNTMKKIWKKSLTEKQQSLAEKDLYKAFKLSDYLEKQDIEYFLTFFKKHHKNWWD